MAISKIKDSSGNLHDLRATYIGNGTIGDGNQPICIVNGVPTAIDYTISTSVPSDAKFTDTTYTALKNPNSLTISLNGTSQGGYDGSAAKSVNVTPDSIGAVPTTEAGTNAALNRLSTGSSDPVDGDYYIAQFAGGGTTTTTFHRRPISKLYNYIKSKLDSVYQPKGNYAASSHTHSYAGSSSAGGSATSAVKLDGGLSVVQSTSEPTNTNCQIWIVG